jgi:hypothetical protein
MDLTTFDERGDVSFDPLTGLGLLTDAEFEALTPAEQLDYLNVAEKLVGSWAYTPRQLVAEQLAAEVDELLYGGAAGGGKSEWLFRRRPGLPQGRAALVLPERVHHRVRALRHERRRRQVPLGRIRLRRLR